MSSRSFRRPFRHYSSVDSFGKTIMRDDFLIALAALGLGVVCFSQVDASYGKTASTGSGAQADTSSIRAHGSSSKEQDRGTRKQHAR